MAEAVHGEIVPIPALADQLEILPVSANQMIRKMEENGLVRYLPYKGVQLTENGRQIADQVRRQHQLWESFLVRYLKFSAQTADGLACRLEHIMSDEESEHLAAFLEDPGRLMDEKDQHFTHDMLDWHQDVPLSDLSVGQSGLVTKVPTDRVSGSFFSAVGLRPGAKATVLATSDSDDMLVLVGESDRIHLVSGLADQIRVERRQP